MALYALRVLQTGVVVFVACSFFLTSAQATDFLADRHVTRGVKCEGCHPDRSSTNVDKNLCLNCHGGSYAKLAENTAALDINPHDTHLGEAQCTTCHHGHKPPVLSCDNCHEFQDMRVP